MKKIKYLMIGVIGFFAFGVANVFAATYEGVLRECLSSEAQPVCEVDNPITLTSDLSVPSDKTVTISETGSITLDEYELSVQGHLFVSSQDKIIISTVSAVFSVGRDSNALYAVGTPVSCNAYFATSHTYNICDGTPTMYMEIEEDDLDEYYVAINADLFNDVPSMFFNVSGVLEYYAEGTIPENEIIRTMDNFSEVIFGGDIINNGHIIGSGSVVIRKNFINNVENGIASKVRVEDGYFENNQDISLEELIVFSEGELKNTADISVTSAYIHRYLVLGGKVNNTGTISFENDAPDMEYQFGYVPENYTGNLPVYTVPSFNANYNERVYYTGLLDDDGDYHQARNGLLLYSGYGIEEINYYNNIISPDKKEYNVVFSTVNTGFDLEILFNRSQEENTFKYEVIELDNIISEYAFNKKNLYYENVNSYGYDYVDNDGGLFSKYTEFNIIDNDKPAYFAYKVKGFSTGEEIIVRGAYTTNDVFSALFEANGGSYTYPVFANTDNKILAPTNPTKDNYSFKGWYTDKELTKEFNFANAVTNNVVLYAKWEKLEYPILEGENLKHTVGTNNDATFRIDGAFNLFSNVYLNDELLDPVFYTATEGSTIITLKSDFLNNLLPGTYNLKTTFTNGVEVTSSLVIETPAVQETANPKTSDRVVTYVIGGSISLIGLLAASLYLKKKAIN